MATTDYVKETCQPFEDAVNMEGNQQEANTSCAHGLFPFVIISVVAFSGGTPPNCAISDTGSVS